jgi:hypothetical protein
MRSEKRFQTKNLEVRHHFGDPGVDDMIILKWMLKNECVLGSTALISLGIRSKGEFL